jgi:hypothetical protein
MKNTIKLAAVLLLLFVPLFLAQAQEYTFDTKTVYSTVYKQNESKQEYFTNSKIKSYSMSISNYNDYLEAHVFDYESKKVHYFKMNINKKNEITPNFIYNNSYDLDTREQLYLKNSYDFKTVEENKDFKKVNLIFYKNVKKKNIHSTLELVLQPNDSNLFNAFRLSCIHGCEHVKRLDINENYIVVSASTVSKDGQLTTHKLIENNAVDLTLKIPQK